MFKFYCKNQLALLLIVVTLSGCYEFNHGVASGDPLVDRVIIWTRVTPTDNPDKDVEGNWRMASDPEMKQVVQSGPFSTGPDQDFTVKIDVTGLQAGHTYYYQFSTARVNSPIGRTKTLPIGDVERLKLAVVSCSQYSAGFFNVYGQIANRNLGDMDLQAVIHLGDYLYEYGPRQFGDASLVGREALPDKEIINLTDYRIRHGQYKTDVDLQALHATHPIIAVWDDHEFANDTYQGGAANHQAEEGAWVERKAAALQAYYEWMPIRESENRENIYRQFNFGRLASLSMLDARLIGRDKPLDFQQAIIDPDAFSTELTKADRQLLGDKQAAWLAARLTDSANSRWQLIGQQVMMGQLSRPLIPNLINDPLLANNNQLAALGNELVAAGKLSGLGMPINLDAWDGYPSARSNVLSMFEKMDNVVVLTGDLHNAWALELVKDEDLAGVYDPASGAGAVAVELLTPSVTSPGFEASFPTALLDLLAQILKNKNPHIKYANLKNRGYLMLDITQEKLQAQWFFTPSEFVASLEEIAGPMFEVQAGSNHLVKVVN